MTATVGWVRPHRGGPPVWGHADGLQIGLHPLPGPRGLIRIYAPYLDHPPGRMINYLAIEPIPSGSSERGYSELERSGLDGHAGLLLWSTGDPADPVPADEPHPGEAGVDRLEVAIAAEPFANGAHVYLRVSFDRSDPYALTVAAFAQPDSVPLDYCILSATMGNWARLRRLELADRTVAAGDLWPDHRGDGFAAHASFALSELRRDEAGAAIVAATSDEPDPATVDCAPGTAEHWRYVGRPAIQEWRAIDPAADLRVQVNGRYTYWASDSPIPGGTAFENVEIVERFRPGRGLTFRVKPVT